MSSLHSTVAHGETSHDRKYEVDYTHTTIPVIFIFIYVPSSAKILVDIFEYSPLPMGGAT